MKKLFIFVIILWLFIGGSYIAFNLKDKMNPVVSTYEFKPETKLDVNFNKYVTTISDAILYKKDDNKFSYGGRVSKDVVLTLEENDINGYFKLEGLDYYIYYKLVKNYEGEYKANNDYKNYIPFNEKITSKKTKLYNDEDEIIYELDMPSEFIPLIKDEDKTYVEYNNQLLYLSNSDISETITTNNELEPEAKAISVLTYHFFYDDTNKDKCNQIICMSRNQLDEQLKYLKDNNYYTLSMKEFEFFLDKKIKLPKKSVLLTADDGWLGANTILPETLKKYDMKGTLFLITGSFNYKDYQFDNLELQSHSTDMHTPGVCNKGFQGAGILCMSESDILKDLKSSKELLNATAFAYPLYDYDDRAKRLVKEAGYSMAFVGKNKQAYPGIDKFEIPRNAVVADTTLNDFIKKLR